MASSAGVVDAIDWTARARSRLYQQFRDKPKLLAVVDAYAAQLQALEDTGQALSLILSIDPITDDPESPLYGIGRGAQLQRVGRIVGQHYTGEAEDLYRLRLRARIRANKSSGTPEELYAVYQALMAGAGHAQIEPSPPAGLVFHANDALTDPEAALLLTFLVDAKVAGVRLWLEWQTTDAAHAFAFASDDYPGLGFGDDADPTVGGMLSGAAEA